MITGPLMNWKAPFSKPNWPVLGMQVFMISTWFLSIADGMVYFNFRCNLNPAIGQPEWGVTDPDSLMCRGINMDFVSPGQIIGSTGLLIGSILYVLSVL